MTLLESIFAALPEIKDNYSLFPDTITLRDDSDGQGAYIAKWDYSKPIPEGLSLGKP